MALSTWPTKVYVFLCSTTCCQVTHFPINLFCALQKECRTRQWIIEPSEDRYLYVRMNGAYMRKHSPRKMHLISEIKSSFATNCATKARFVFTNGEGLSVTACPASENSADNSFVEIFSSGWDSYNQFKDLHPMRSISIEYLDPDDEDYSFTWFEMVPRVSLGLVGT